MYKAFVRAKALDMERMENPRIVPLAWYRESWEEQEAILGRTPGEYGIDRTQLKNLERLVSYSLEQGLSKRGLRLDELSHLSEGRAQRIQVFRATDLAAATSLLPPNIRRSK